MERKWKITTTKDTMLHILNNIFNQNVKSSMTKENMLKLLPDLYKGENLVELIKVISYEAYESLEKILKYVEEGMELKEAVKKVNFKVDDLEEAMIIILRMSGIDMCYSLTVNAEELAPMFSEENKKIAKKYDRIEKIVTGLIYSYGVIEIETLRKLICKYMKEIMPEDELFGFLFKRLKLNMLLEYHHIHWENNGQEECYLAYTFDDEDIDASQIAVEQKGRGLKYKQIKEKDILAREEYLWNEKTQEFYKYLKTKNDMLKEEDFKLLIKKNELGENILEDLLSICFIFDEKEANEFVLRFMDWYNNYPQYMLGGYTPMEMMTRVE